MVGVYALLAVILTGQIVPMFLSILNPDTSNIYVLSGLYVLIFSLYFLIFVIFAKMRATRPNHKPTYKELLQTYNFKKPNVQDSGIIVVLGVLCILAYMTLQTGLIEVFASLGHTPGGIAPQMENFGHYILIVIAIAVLPSIVEELLFRGLILHSLMPFGKTVAVFTSALLFSLFHMNPSQTVFQFFLGIIFALIYIRTKNMWYPMLLHFVNNFAIITYTYVTRGAYESALIFNWQVILVMWTLVVVGTLIAVSLVRCLKKSKQPSIELHTVLTDNMQEASSQEISPVTQETNLQSNSSDRKFIGSKEFIGFMACAAICVIVWIVVFLN